MNTKLATTIRRLPLVIALILVMSAPMMCALTPDIKGKWVGTAPNGDVVTMIFRDDESMQWSISRPDGTKGVVHAKYKISYDNKPLELDIFDFDLDKFSKFTFQGIVEFRGTDRVAMIGEYTDKGEDVRPSDFGEYTIEFNRVPNNLVAASDNPDRQFVASSIPRDSSMPYLSDCITLIASR